ncbi:electron transport complex subunit RsxC [bacterium]|nr:electron transport complex subunit RsxC [candidate division CSSED10-310 bacterium]
MKLFTFPRGGVHPPDHKAPSAHQSIRLLPLPGQVAIAMNQHLGKPAKCLVKKGQDLTVGEKIGEADGFISASVHSSVAGKVSRVDPAMTAVGTWADTVFIDVDNEATAAGYRAFTNQTPADWRQMDSREMIGKIQVAGIVGMGGAAFPTNVKLSPPPDKTIDTILINGAECEPYLTADHQLMLERSADLLAGIGIMQRILGIENTWIGIEANKPDAIAVLEKLITDGNHPGIRVAPLKTRYPQGGEKQLITAVTGRVVPSGKLPFEVGCLVQNTGTAIAIYEAVCLDKPLIDRITTITGFVKQPGNFRIPIGVAFDHAIDSGAGGFIDAGRVRAVINGGPMMGKTVRTIDIGTMKGTSGILVLADTDYNTKPEGPCIRCGRCIDGCPMGLMPTSLALHAEFNKSAGLKDVMDCIECGTCSYVCPTHRQLVHWLRIGKTIFRNADRS